MEILIYYLIILQIKFDMDAPEKKRNSNETYAKELLNISTALLNNTTSKDLLQTIYDTIKPIFPFDNAGLFLIDHALDVFWEILEEGILPQNDLQDSLATNDLLGPFAYTGNHPDTFFYADTPIIFSVEAQSKIYQNPQWKLMKAYGLKEMIAGPLMVNDKKLGFFCFNSKEEGFYTEKDFELFEAIGNQLAIAVSNIITNEELQLRQKRIEDLLKISTAATKIKNRIELLKVIFEILKPIFPFDSAGLFIINQKEDLHYEILDDVDILGFKDTSQISLIEANLLGAFKHKGSAVDFLSQGNQPHLFSIIDDGKKWPHPQFELMLQAGLSQIIGIGLRSGSETFGMLCFNAKEQNFYTEASFPFFKAISEQMALAVKNVLANEKILLEKQKIENLLRTSEAISTIGNTNELVKVLSVIINEVFPFDEAGLFALDFEKGLEKDFFVDHITTSVNLEIRESGHSGWCPITEVTKYIAENDTVIMDFEELAAKFEHPHLEVIKKQNYKQIIGGPLKAGNTIIGMLCFWTKKNNGFKQVNIPFFKSISDQLSVALENLLNKEEILRLNQELKLERDYLIEEVKSEHNFEEIIGNSPLLREIFKSVEMVSHTDATVLIEGETGTGKELIARAIHNRSNRKKKPMVKVNCATLPKELIESELFGHEKGSFTGAFERRIGKFELANKSTLFLDEVGEMPLELQAKLLRAIQEKEIERLGGKETIKVDVRIIAATNRNLLEESEKGEFRSDLYYRLNVFPIRMPALSERTEDIPLLATYFAQKYCNKLNTDFKGIKEKSMQELLEYKWPGNIRELENLVEQACILNQGKALSWARELVPAKPKKRVPKEKQNNEGFDIKAIREEQLNQERETILKALKQTSWRIRGNKGAAKLLGVKPTTLEYRITKLGLK